MEGSFFEDALSETPRLTPLRGHFWTISMVTLIGPFLKGGLNHIMEMNGQCFGDDRPTFWGCLAHILEVIELNLTLPIVAINKFKDIKHKACL